MHRRLGGWGGRGPPKTLTPRRRKRSAENPNPQAEEEVRQYPNLQPEEELTANPNPQAEEELTDSGVSCDLRGECTVDWDVKGSAGASYDFEDERSG